MNMNRRQFLKAFGQVVAAYTVAGVGLYQYGTHLEPEWLIVEQVQIPLKNLKPALEGFRIVQISDIHIDSYTQVEVVQIAVIRPQPWGTGPSAWPGSIYLTAIRQKI